LHKGNGLYVIVKKKKSIPKNNIMLYKILPIVVFILSFCSISLVNAHPNEEQEARELFTKGNEAFRGGDFKLAVDFFSKAISKAPTKPALYFNRGSTYAILKEYQKAIRDFTKTIELSPGHFDAYNHRGLAYHDLRQFDKAISDFNKSLTIDSNFVIAMVNKGTTLSYLKRYNEALYLYEKALSILEEDRPEATMIRELIEKTTSKLQKK